MNEFKVYTHTHTHTHIYILYVWHRIQLPDPAM